MIIFFDSMLCPEVISSFWKDKCGTWILLASIDCLCINGTALIRLSGFKPKSDTEIILLAEMLFAQSKSADSKQIFSDRNVLMCFIV